MEPKTPFKNLRNGEDIGPKPVDYNVLSVKKWIVDHSSPPKNVPYYYMGRWNRDPSPFEVKSLVHKARVFGNPKSFWTSKVLIMPFFQLSPWRQPSYVMSTWHKPLWSRADIYRSLQYMIPRFFKRFGQEKHLQENPPENPPVFPKWSSSRLEFTSLTTKTSHVFWFNLVKLYPLVNWHSYWKWP